jgi:arginyl-tRNA synthetase
MSLFTQTRQLIIDSLNIIAGVQGLAPVDTGKVTVEAPKDKTHGDLATNAAMVTAKAFGLPPRDVAALLCQQLGAHKNIIHTAIAGPGFINLTLAPTLWQDELQTILTQGVHYGDSALGGGQRVMVEFVSANPTGPIHAGHGRNAILGDAIAALLQKVGFHVYREYYVNDAGGQVDALARSVHLRYREALGETLPANAFEGDLYPGDYLVSMGQKLATAYGRQFENAPEAEWLPLFKQTAVAHMLELIQADLALLGVTMDHYRSEIAVTQDGRVEEVLTLLEKRGDIYAGTLEKPKGHQVDDWEERPQTLFKATAYGDDVDRALKKSDGSWTYFAGDMGYHLDKFKRGFTYMVNVFGADHAGYVKRLTAAVNALTDGHAHFEIKVSQMVNFMDQGQPVRMSKREGTFITVRDVIERVGRDATRYMMIFRHNDMALDFDFAKVVEQNRDNPIFYIQYAHARICSVMRHAQSQWPTAVKRILQADLTLLHDEAELDMIKVLAQWPKQVEIAALAREPHRLAHYLYDLAGAFHALWNKGRESTHLRFIDPANENLTSARLALLKGVANVLQSGLTLLNITPLEELRA